MDALGISGTEARPRRQSNDIPGPRSQTPPALLWFQQRFDTTTKKEEKTKDMVLIGHWLADD